MKRENQKYSIFAILGLVLSITIYFSFFGLILSIIGIIETSKDRKKGRGLAVAGLVISLVLMLLVLPTIIWAFIIPSTLQKANDLGMGDCSTLSGESYSECIGSRAVEEKNISLCNNWEEAREVWLCKEYYSKILK